MSFNIVEQRESREFQDSNGILSASRVFHVSANDGTLITPLKIQDLFGSTGTSGETLPQYREYFIDDGRLVAVAPRIRPVDMVGQLWEVTWNYRAFNFGQKQPLDIGFVDISGTASSEFREKWRDGYSIPANGDVTPGSQVPVDGGWIDIAGRPLSVVHYTQRFSISETIAGFPLFPVYRAFRAARNSLPFLGLSVGTVLYLGFDFRTVSPGRWVIEHQFVEDSDSHLLQTARLGADGEPLLVSDAGDGVTHADTVYWRQPFQKKLDLYNLSSNFITL